MDTINLETVLAHATTAQEAEDRIRDALIRADPKDKRDDMRVLPCTDGNYEIAVVVTKYTASQLAKFVLEMEYDQRAAFHDNRLQEQSDRLRFRNVRNPLKS